MSVCCWQLVLSRRNSATHNCPAIWDAERLSHNQSSIKWAKSQAHNQHGRSRVIAYRLKLNMKTQILDSDKTAPRMHAVFPKTQPNKKSTLTHDKPVFTAASLLCGCHTTTREQKRKTIQYEHRKHEPRKKTQVKADLQVRPHECVLLTDGTVAKK